MVLATYSLSIWVTLPLRLRHSTTPSEKRFVSVKCYPPMYKLNYGVPTVRCAGGAD